MLFIKLLVLLLKSQCCDLDLPRFADVTFRVSTFLCCRCNLPSRGVSSDFFFLPGTSCFLSQLLNISWYSDTEHVHPHVES